VGGCQPSGGFTWPGQFPFGLASAEPACPPVFPRSRKEPFFFKRSGRKVPLPRTSAANDLCVSTQRSPSFGSLVRCAPLEVRRSGRREYKAVSAVWKPWFFLLDGLPFRGPGQGPYSSQRRPFIHRCHLESRVFARFPVLLVLDHSDCI